jgi:hypothetical protein
VAVVRKFIAKFGREVLIDDDHPLARAEDTAPAKAAAPELTPVAEKAPRAKKDAG